MTEDYEVEVAVYQDSLGALQLSRHGVPISDKIPTSCNCFIAVISPNLIRM